MSESEDWEEDDMDWLDDMIARQLGSLEELNDQFTTISALLSEENRKSIRKLIVDMLLYNSEAIEGDRLDEAQSIIESFHNDFFRGMIVGVAIMLDAHGLERNMTTTASDIYHNATNILFERTGVHH